ncbi:MAG: hypothetical protein HYZ75_04065 [Elusimicrobia bacterium]|nr:hypothetical protein [Elusimicrobiota bacterium]
MARKHKAAAPAGPSLGEILRRNPKAIAVLHKHGVQVCSGCVITLGSTPEKAASYHAVPDPAAFARDLKKAVARTRR